MDLHVFHALRQPDGKRLGPESWLPESWAQAALG